MEKREVKWGAILSYILIFINSVYGLIITPFILGTIGESEYGVYKTIGAIASTISVMEFGLGGTTQRFIAKYRAQKKKLECSNFSAMCLLQAGILAVSMLIIGFVLFFTIEPMYGNTFTDYELLRAKQIFVLLIVYVSLHIFENVYYGIIAGYNRFVISNSLKISAILIKVILYLVILPVFKNSLVIVVISLCVEILIIVFEYLYVSRGLHHKIRLYCWDKKVFKESFSYTALLFIQSIIIQFNGNVDNIVIGAVIGTSAVTVYSFAIQIFNMYEQFSTAISGVILPSVTNMIYHGATTKELEDMVIKFGRIQWSVLGAALGGFICLGKEFFNLWVGDGFQDCYYLALILMIPVTIPLIVNACLAILKARNMLAFRTLSLGYSALVNAIITLLGTYIWGYWAAATGTAISTIVGSIISLNIYYKVKLDINILRVYMNIFKKITICILCACCSSCILNQHLYGNWSAFMLKASIYMFIFLVTMLLWGLTKSEKDSLIVRGKRK